MYIIVEYFTSRTRRLHKEHWDVSGNPFYILPNVGDYVLFGFNRYKVIERSYDPIKTKWEILVE